jgi:hypothetical protein
MSTQTLEPPTVILRLCTHCGQAHGSIFRICPDCLEAVQKPQIEAEQTAAREEIRAKRAREWLALCPLDYRSTNWRDHAELSAVCRTLAKDWLPQWESEERGLGIHGPSGMGKTRAMFAILRRLHFAGVGVHYVEAVKFDEQARIADDLRAPWSLKGPALDFLHRCKSVRVLFFDDLGKESSILATAKHMHDTFEHRGKHRLPLLWTSERTGEELARFLGENYADGIIRRLRRSCAIHFAEPPALPEPHE